MTDDERAALQKANRADYVCVDVPDRFGGAEMLSRMAGNGLLSYYGRQKNRMLYTITSSGVEALKALSTKGKS